MKIPAEMRRRPPPATLAWVERSVGNGARIVRVRRLRNASAAAVHAIDVDHRGTAHRLVLRRWARVDPPADVGVVENEVAALGVIADSGLPVPRLLAADAQGGAADAPAVLMTRLPGRDVIAPHNLDAFLQRLAATLRAVHDVPVAPGILNYFRPWNLDTSTEPPAWSRQPDVWARAIEVAREPVPAHTRALCHRDFHPGNVLWQRGKVTGIVDWTHACRGPASADVAHCRVNLALLFGTGAADDFARYYGALDDLAWHDVADAISIDSSELPEAWRWHDAGRPDITPDRIIDTFDDFVIDALNRLERRG